MNDETKDKDGYGHEHTREEIEEKIARGLAQLERGEDVDGEEVFEKLRKRGQDLRAPHQ